jgi:PHD/YefM family antitoxin component YafN of YafNO toxin-antitoxin module
MPRIIPIRDLKKTREISEMCRNAKEPVFITRNGYDDMVIMSMGTYEKMMFVNEVYNKLDQAEESIRKGEVMDGFESLKGTREKYVL